MLRSCLLLCALPPLHRMMLSHRCIRGQERDRVVGMKLLSWIAMVSVLWVAIRVETKDHNGEAYQALCQVLREAVKKWGDRGTGLSGSLKKALGKTIFGKGHGDGQDLEKLREGLPGDYRKEGANRELFCGSPYSSEYGGNPARWSGHSAPHDLLCLCTLGEAVWLTSLRRSGTEKLCAQDVTAGKLDSQMGWVSDDYEDGESQLIATWFNVTLPCLNDGGGAESLTSALQKFKEKLGVPAPGTPAYRILGEVGVTGSTTCSG
ncbi:unnamed protein product, partial [Trypanosoma congolense IL3000]